MRGYVDFLSVFAKAERILQFNLKEESMQETYRNLVEAPVFFERNRVYRITKGGALFHDLFGDEALDTNYPEEWVASDVPASLNKGKNPREGISKVRGTDIYFDELLRAEPEKLLGNSSARLGILVKILDGSMRLPVQVHPDKEFSRKYLSSDYGKTEAWLILSTRGDACIYFGFESSIDESIFIDAIEKNKSDRNALVALMHKITVRPGDVFLIPARAAHAIGAGIMLLEIQEPTDFTITPEAWCGDSRIDEGVKYLGLSRETALRCFDYKIYGTHAEEIGQKYPRIIGESPEVLSEQLVGYDDTPCFSVNRHRVSGSLVLPHAPAVYFVTEGAGSLGPKGISGRQEKSIQRGDYFFLPYILKNQWMVKCRGKPLEIIECLPPKAV
jgi:mannose-6-phosphate isomerase